MSDAVTPDDLRGMAGNADEALRLGYDPSASDLTAALRAAADQLDANDDDMSAMAMNRNEWGERGMAAEAKLDAVKRLRNKSYISDLLYRDTPVVRVSDLDALLAGTERGDERRAMSIKYQPDEELPARDATPDEAYELGYDEAWQEAVQGAAANARDFIEELRTNERSARARIAELEQAEAKLDALQKFAPFHDDTVRGRDPGRQARRRTMTAESDRMADTLSFEIAYSMFFKSDPPDDLKQAVRRLAADAFEAGQKDGGKKALEEAANDAHPLVVRWEDHGGNIEHMIQDWLRDRAAEYDKGTE